MLISELPTKSICFTCAQEPIKAPLHSFDCDAVILAGNGDFNVKLYRGQFETYQRTYVFSLSEKVCGNCSKAPAVRQLSS